MPPAENKKLEDNEPKKATFAEESQSNEDLARRIKDLESTLAATRAGMPLSLTPEHGAGPGQEINETWSQAEQETALSAEPEPFHK
jgi:hypothetical protein